MGNLKLSITTIGDLLLRNKITNGDNPIEDVNLVIPIYQRPYKWTVRNAIQLLDDIIDAMTANKEKYRVGTLILHNSKGSTYDIVDGQQRTITFALLLKAIGNSEIGFLDAEVYGNEYNAYNITNNYNALCRRFVRPADDAGDEYNRETLKLKDYIENRCELIVVITSDVSEAFQFFDSQNSRGKSLYPHDLLKAYHLREMSDVPDAETESIVKGWEQVSQTCLASLFGNYLYRIKEWMNGNRADILNEHNIQMFKGITRYERTPYAQFYKGAYSYASMVNSSSMPFVSGIRPINAFQLDTPIIAGKPFFDYTRHYYTILKDIQDNSRYEGFYIKDNAIVNTLDRYFKCGVGNCISRLLFDTSVMLYVDRFCPETHPTKEDLSLFEQFVVYAFIWSYSLRAQYVKLGWQSAQNYIMGCDGKINSFNIYQIISRQDTPASLLGIMADKLEPLSDSCIKDSWARKNIGDVEDGVHKNYMYFFKKSGFYK